MTAVKPIHMQSYIYITIIIVHETQKSLICCSQISVLVAVNQTAKVKKSTTSYTFYPKQIALFIFDNENQVKSNQRNKDGCTM